jgi:phospholipid/cholesterol/gamma-HCH transport system ATP-binding protein
MIKIKNLKKSFNGKPVLDGINLTIEDGKTTVIIGESGCGKTVLLKHLVGFYKPDAGEIYLNDYRIDNLCWRDLNKVRRNFTMVFQRSALFDWLTVYENVALPLREHTKLSEEKIKEEVKSKLELVGLLGEEEKMPSQLSGGMQKRVSIARALILNPKYIFYDEPTTGLDPIIARNIINLFSKLQKKLKTTSLIASHDIYNVFQIADKVAMMKDGKIFFERTPEDFIKSSNSYINSFMNRLPLRKKKAEYKD